jgi:outer membrane receptor for ferrienterochelin and colicins
MKKIYPTSFAAMTVFAASISVAQTPTPAASPTPSPAKAEDKPTPKVEPKKAEPKVETIEVKSTGVYDERKDDTATKLVVNSAEIMKFGDTQLADVLKRLPGITVQGTSIRMRGLGAGYTQILIDGERAPPGFTIDQLSPTMIERIEILRAATAEFSTQSIAGTINIVLKKKVNLSQREVRAVYEQGSFYKAPSANFVVSDKDGRFSYSVNGYVYGGKNTNPFSNVENGFDSAGNRILFRTSDGLTNGKFKGAGAGPRLNWTLKNGDMLIWQSFINLNHGDGKGASRFNQVIGAPPPTNSNEWRYEFVNDFVRTDLNWITKLAEGAKLDTKIGVSANVNRNNNYTRGFNPNNQQNLDRSVEVTGRNRGVTFTGKYSTPIVEGHSLVTGWDTGLTKRREENNQRDIAFPGVLPAIAPINVNEAFDAEILRLAAFAQDEWNVTKQWSIYLGLRWEGITTTSEGSRFSEVRNRSSVWSPIAQTLYKLPDRKGEQIRLALTRTYKAPTTNSLIPRRFTSVDNKPTAPDLQGNPELRPELATGIDIALEKFWDQGASVSLSTAIRRITGYNRQGLRFINGRWVQLPINDGQAETKSLEFDAKLPLQKFYPTAPGIDFRLNMNRNWSNVDSIPGPNNRLDQQIPFSGTVGLDYRMKNGVVSAGGSYSYKSGGDVRTGVSQSAFITAKRDLDVYALWKITPKTQVRLTLSNILKPLAVTETAYFDSFGRTVNSTTRPSKPNVRIGLEMKL